MAIGKTLVIAAPPESNVAFLRKSLLELIKVSVYNCSKYNYHLLPLKAQKRLIE